MGFMQAKNWVLVISFCWILCLSNLHAWDQHASQPGSLPCAL